MLRLISMEDLTHGYCQTHRLRELRAVKEQQEEWAEKMPWYLLVLERFVRRSKRRDSMLPNRGSPEITEDLKVKINRRYDDIMGAPLQNYEELPPWQSGKRGRRKKRPGHIWRNVCERNVRTSSGSSFTGRFPLRIIWRNAIWDDEAVPEDLR